MEFESRSALSFLNGPRPRSIRLSLTEISGVPVDRYTRRSRDDDATTRETSTQACERTNTDRSGRSTTPRTVRTAHGQDVQGERAGQQGQRSGNRDRECVGTIHVDINDGGWLRFRCFKLGSKPLRRDTPSPSLPLIPTRFLLGYLWYAFVLHS